MLNGWRANARIHLRSEAARFALTALGLDLWSDARRDTPATQDEAERQFVRRFGEFLSHQPRTWWSLAWNSHSTEEVRHDAFPGLTTGRYAPDGAVLEVSSGPPEWAPAYNATRGLPDEERVPQLLERLGELAVPAKTVLEGVHVVFELLTSRHALPDFTLTRHPGNGLLNVRCRLHADFQAVDVWIQIHHTPVDGVPMQEVLEALKQEWGVLRPARWSGRESDIVASAHDMDTALRILDFRSLFAWRRRLQEANPDVRVGVGAAVMWGLSQQPAFAGRRIGMAVDVPEAGGQERAVAMLGIQPSAYSDLPTFCQEYSKRLAKIRSRTDPISQTLQKLAALPASERVMTESRDPTAQERAVGRVGISIISQAEIFMAPFERSYCDGFLAFGALQPLGAVTAKGPREVAQRAADATRGMLGWFDS